MVYKIHPLQDHIDNIYSFSVKKDELGLRRYLNDRSLPVESLYNFAALAGRLVRDNQNEAIDFLKKQFSLCPRMLQVEYAACGNVEAAEYLQLFTNDLNWGLLGLARAGLKELAYQKISEDKYPLYGVVKGFAMSGYIAEVEEFLTRIPTKETMPTAFAEMATHLQATYNAAIEGYALAGLDVEVERMLKRGAKIKCGLEGYAYIGRVEKVEEMLRRGAKINDAIQAYASVGLCEQVNQLMQRNSTIAEKNLSNEYALCGYAIAGMIDLAEEILPELELQQFVYTGYSNYILNLRFMTHILSVTKSQYSRDLCHKVLRDKKNNFSEAVVTDVISKSNQIRNIIQTYRIDYNLAEMLVFEGLKHYEKIWLMQGRNVSGLDLDGYLHISSYVLGLSDKNTLALYKAYELKRDEISCFAQQNKSLVNYSIFTPQSSPEISQELNSADKTEELTPEASTASTERAWRFCNIL